ncbi:hypothetical protein PAPYR_790 [Paratrimastix pyriformis]|uniref:MYND-type domain-containing protein n=1 Tax=Paratrimastix pyriformis TaxID=342808 RepID=A0ABQ8UWE8_9EUKA|nr:hypothetical protein PAPYR_790 [Paratrimastix pyriformis]
MSGTSIREWAKSFQEGKGLLPRHHMPSPSQICPVCCKPATFRCSACQTQWYCNSAHQQQHWTTHKLECHRCRRLREDLSTGIYPLPSAQAERLFQRISSIGAFERADKMLIQPAGAWAAFFCPSQAALLSEVASAFGDTPTTVPAQKPVSPDPWFDLGPLRCLTGLLSPLFTISLALRRLGLGTVRPRVDPLAPIRVQIIGCAEEIALGRMGLFAHLACLLPQYGRFEIDLVGPPQPQQSDFPQTDRVAVRLVPRGQYSPTRAPVPDLVVLLGAFLHLGDAPGSVDPDPWALIPAVAALLDQDIPILYTAPTQSVAEQSHDTLTSAVGMWAGSPLIKEPQWRMRPLQARAACLWGPEQAPWPSMHPEVAGEPIAGVPVLGFANSWWGCVAGRMNEEAPVRPANFADILAEHAGDIKICERPSK